MNGAAGLRHAWIERLALLCMACVLFVLADSAYIRLIRLGVGCDLAAGCGEIATGLPRTLHRLVAVLSLLLALTIAGICFLRKPVLRAEGRSALVALGWMAFLAGWGIWGGASHAPLVVAGNVLGGMALLAAVWRVFLAASPAAAAGGNAGRGAIWGLRVGLALLVMQIVLGSWLGGSRAMLECAMAGRCMEAMAGVLFLHRFSGFGVAAVLAVSALFAAQLAPGCRSGVKRLLASLAGVLLLGLGGAAIGPPLMFAVLHNLAVALTFAFAAGLLRQLRRT